MAQQPPAAPPPAPPPPPPVPGAPIPGQRPTQATTAATLLFIVGGLRLLLGLIAAIVVMGAADRIGDEPDGGTLLAVVAVVLVVLLVAAALQIAGGRHTLAMRPRGFSLGISGTIIGLLLGVLGLAGAAQGNSTPLNILITVLLLVGDIVILMQLSQARRFMTPA